LGFTLRAGLVVDLVVDLGAVYFGGGFFHRPGSG
jgi:hypothetical protein